MQQVKYQTGQHISSGFVTSLADPYRVSLVPGQLISKQQVYYWSSWSI